MAIRRARGTDVEAIRRVAERSWEHDYPTILTRETITDGVEEWYGAESIRADLGNPRSVILVAVRDGHGEKRDEEAQVVGFVQSHRADEGGTVLRLYVDPNHRREGVATALFDAVTEQLEGDGAETIRAMALAENDQGCAFYRSLGLNRVETDTTTIGGQRFDEAVFERRGAHDRREDH